MNRPLLDGGGSWQQQPWSEMPSAPTNVPQPYQAPYQAPQPSPLSVSRGPQPWLNQYGAASQDETAIYRDWFIAVDLDRSQKINNAELTSALRAGGESFSPKTIDLMIKLFGEPDNCVHFEGFILLFKYIQAMRSSFDALDSRRKGTLTLDEVRMAITKAQFNFADPNTVAQLFKKFDYFQENAINFAQYMELAVFLGNIRNAFEARNWQKSAYLPLFWHDFVSVCTEL